MRTLRLVFIALVVALVAAACGEPEGQDEPPRTSVVETDDVPSDQIEIEEPELGDEAGGNDVFALLSVTVSDEDAETLIGEISGLAPGAVAEFEASSRQFVVAPGASLDCALWDGPSLRVSFETGVDQIEAVVEYLHAHDSVVAIDAPSAGIFLDGEEPFVECESRQVSVLFDPSIAFDASSLIGRAFAIEGVVAVSTGLDGGTDGSFAPDLSGYPDAQDCYGPVFDDFTLFLAVRDPEATQAIVDEFSTVEGVEGFTGWDVEESLDPIRAWENSAFGEEGDAHFQECEGLEAYVRLEPTISDSDAALVASRATAIPGVADVNLRLVDPDALLEGCEGMGVGGATLGIGVYAHSVLDCSSITSELTIYRGDKSLATPLTISSALCDLPGVLDISVYDHEKDLEFADPYETCGSLYLSVLLDSEMIGGEGDPALEPVFAALDSSDIVSHFDGPHFADYEVYEQTVVWGEVDELLCLNALETTPSIGMDLVRTTRDESEALAHELEGLDIVIRVIGNAIGTRAWSPALCGYDGLSLHLVRGAGEDAIQAVVSTLKDRDDVLAVVVEEETPHMEGDVDYGSWVLVKFNTVEPPEDLDQLVGRIAGLPEVMEAEAWDWAWEE